MRKLFLLLGIGGILGACAAGGGGGEPSPTASPLAAATPAEIPADLTRDLAGESRDYVEAYARAPWVHANAISREWGRAREDLGFIRERLVDLAEDEDVDPGLKVELERLMPSIARLDEELAAEKPQAVKTAAALVVQFTTLSNQTQVSAWLGQEGGGGGGPYRAPAPRGGTP
ncbi:MAG: hypothetical protein ACLGIN_00145 [Candidatus Sericytochromatia bacterium]